VIQLFTYAGKKAAARLALVLFVLCPALCYAAVDITLSVDKAEVRQNEQVTFTVKVYNRSSVEAADMLAVSTLPKGVSLLSCNAANVAKQERSLLVTVPTLRAGEEYSFEVAVRMERKGSVEYLLQLQQNGAAVKEVSSTVNVLSNNVLSIEVTMFTPNGDGINDYFEIPGLLSYPNNEIVVFNRFSDRVYQKRGYTNDWSAAGLPNGNYFYILTVHLDNGTIQKYNGHVAVRR